MSEQTIIETTAEEVTTPPPVSADANGHKRERKSKVKEDKDDDKVETTDDEAVSTKAYRGPVSAELRQVQKAEDMDLKDLLDSLGTDGSYKISVNRLEPEQARDPQTSQMVQVSGFLKTYECRVDPEFLTLRHGGGKYRLVIHKRAPDGSFKIAHKRVVEVAGDPRTDDVPRNMPPVAPQPVQSSGGTENGPIVKEMFSLVKETMKDRASPQEPRGIDPAAMAMMDMLKNTIATQQAEMRELREEMRAQQNKPIPEDKNDTYKNLMIEKLMDQDSARIAAVRAQYESEIRQLKEGFAQTENRLRDGFDRDMRRLEDAHIREIGLLKSSYDTTNAATKITLDTSKEVLNAQIKTLERENSQLRNEITELRAKKEKSPLELAKEFKTYKEVFGDEEGGDEKTTVDQIVAALPGAIEMAQGVLNKNKPAPQAPPQQQQPQRPQVMRDQRTGESFIARGNELIPVRKKGQKVQIPSATEGAPPQEVEIPTIEPEKLELAVGFMERAFSGNQEPATFAASVKAMIPPDVLGAIQSLGIDVFLAKVAKLPGTSPLATQAGRNWVRKIGKELVGE